MLATYSDLKNKSVVVTGANGGMGSAIVAALAGAGALVLASDIQSEAGTAIGSLQNVHYVATDVQVEAEVESLVTQAVTRYGKLDCAVNAAAIEFETKRLHEADVTEFDRLIAVNLRGLFLCMKFELKAMLASAGAGSVVNIASTTSFQPSTLQPGYGASKHGVLGLTKQAALDYAADDIRINAIAPGNVDTPMLRGALERRGVEAQRVERMMPLKRFGTTQEVAEATLWLCSEASSFTTGHTIAVEGGMLIA